MIILTKHGGFLSVQHLVRERHGAGRNELVILIQLLISDSIKLIEHLRDLLVGQKLLAAVYLFKEWLIDALYADQVLKESDILQNKIL